MLCEGIPFFCVLNKIKSLFSEREKRLLKKEKVLLDELNISMQDGNSVVFLVLKVEKATFEGSQSKGLDNYFVRCDIYL